MITYTSARAPAAAYDRDAVPPRANAFSVDPGSQSDEPLMAIFTMDSTTSTYPTPTEIATAEDRARAARTRPMTPTPAAPQGC